MQIPQYPAPARALADGDVALMSVDGKTNATPVEAIADYVADKLGTGGGGGGGGGGTPGAPVTDYGAWSA